MIERADYVIDIGPKAGKFGGEIISKGTPKEILERKYHYGTVHEW
jgi:excinuclease ABC subunit A